MLELREADLPLLFLVLIVLPLVTYIILGKLSEDAKKKSKNKNALPQLAFVEAQGFEHLPSLNFSPIITSSSSKLGIHSCAKCLAPATTRCSKCKSVRYCSGKCQIMHWRLGHKLECQQLANGQYYHSGVESSSEVLGKDNCKSLDRVFTLNETKLNTLKKEQLGRKDGVVCALDDTVTSGDTKSTPMWSMHKQKYASERETSTIRYLENEDASLSVFGDDASVQESLMYKRPPYTLDDLTTDKQSRAAMKLSGPRKLVSNNNNNNNFNKTKMLFPYEDLVKFFQCEVWGITPRGLVNCGNSCYANVVLQCLTCTKPLTVYLLRRSHSKTCRVRDWCLMCELEQHVLLLREGGGPLSPNRILSNMRNIGCRMGGGNQEDAHEFLRLLVMLMQLICLDGIGGEKGVNQRLQETTLIQQIFGGRLKSKVKCLRCHLESERHEHIMDLTLEIHGWVESLEDALTQFTAPEDLDGENMYRCGRCDAYVKARKQLSLHEVPNILTIVLKRFQTGKYGKINKCVTFPEMLDMIPFVTGTADSPPLYMLYGVVVHLDTENASFSGHYVSYVKDLQGTWFRINDSEVQAVSISEVMSEGAYMLFYSRSFPRPPRAYVEKTSRNSGNHSSKELQTTLPSAERYENSITADFSDATSSKYSLFTTSDDSSFTTESQRDSFSTIDHCDSSAFDPASLFAPLYMQEYHQYSHTSNVKIGT